MKTLRNILPILILVLTVSISEAQKNKIYSAQTNIEAYLQSKNPDDLLQAKQIIDEVVKHEKTVGFWKAWYTYAKVYQLLGSDSVVKMFSSSKVVAMQGDWTKANETILNFIKLYNRYGIPFNIIFGRKYEDGIILPEILTKESVIENLRLAKGKN